MTGVPSMLHLFICLLLWQTSGSFLGKDFQDYIFHLEDHISLLRAKRTVSDDQAIYEAAIEISFPDPSLATTYTNLLQNLDVYKSLPSSIVILNVDPAPVCTSNESYANCSCKENYSCVGTSGPCSGGNCICITPLPLHKYCLANTSITVSPDTIFQGDKVTIDCKFSDLGNISWYWNSKTKISDSQKYSTSSSQQGTMMIYTLNIRNVTDTDKGNYTCSLPISGTQQNQTTAIDKIQTLQIQSPTVVDSYCDGPVLNLNCCSVNIRYFEVTWNVSSGTPTIVNDCSIYTLIPSTQQCPSVINYNCTFHRNEGITASKIISVYYIQRANIIIPASFSRSIGANEKITCEADFNNTIVWAKDTLTNIVNSSNILVISNATTAWNGVYICIVSQRSLNTSANLTINIIPLPRRGEMVVYPLLTFTTNCSTPQKLTCCVPGSGYRVTFTSNAAATPDGDSNCYSTTIRLDKMCNQKNVTVQCVVFNSRNDNVTSDVMTIAFIQSQSSNCKAQNQLPESPSGYVFTMACQAKDNTTLGTINYTCTNGIWSNPTDGCYSANIFKQLVNAQDIINGPEVKQKLPEFVQNLTVTATTEKQNLQETFNNVKVMVDIISTVSEAVLKANVTVEPIMMQNFIKTVDIVVDKSIPWNKEAKESATILSSVESFAQNLNFSKPIDFKNESISNIQLYGQIVKKDDNYSQIFDVLNLTGNVFIDKGALPDDSTKVVTIAYGTMKDILPNDTKKVVNGLVMSTIVGTNSSKSNTFKINMTYSISNTKLKQPDCVWYNFTENVWSDSGCSAIDKDDQIYCSCIHLTSFSILMGDAEDLFLDIITYVGVGISLACLVITLLIEALVWDSVIKNKTSYIRHVCLVNIAVTLLVADIWFIIGAVLQKKSNLDACKAVAFLSFFFYLSMFFWMLTTGLILFYRMIYILHDMSRKTMMIIAFLLGYGCPLIITVVTVASTEPSNKFISNKFCWLDYNDSRSFLAFVVPVLTIVFINMLIMVVVIIKLMRPTVGEKTRDEDRKILITIAKTTAILTPLLGTTWGFGLGVAVEPTNKVIHGVFAALNSFQGLFILISTVLLDQKVRKAIRSSISSSYLRTFRSRGQTTSTDSSGPSKSKGRKNPFRKTFFGKKAVYHFYSNQGSSEASANSYSMLT